MFYLPFLLLQPGVDHERGEIAEIQETIQFHGPIHLGAEDNNLRNRSTKGAMDSIRKFVYGFHKTDTLSRDLVRKLSTGFHIEQV